MWNASDCKKNGYLVSKKYKWDKILFDAWGRDCEYFGHFHSAQEAFSFCEENYKTRQTKAN